ncbi:MAG: ABC transporter ATP-binding protein [Deltaproteobacteria bacterium]|nr:ABC transporter ATP-binding protein [Deltaproteobacteria bacterium]MCL5792899.1 ABC transporter ATP-binding protein [Deltaproteobacteria bacterium]
MNAIECRDIELYYKKGFFRKSHVLKGLSFTVEKGQIYGFLGPNGAGKTTTIKLINDFIKKSSGIIKVFNIDARDISARALIGYMPENPMFYTYLNAYEFLSFVSRLKGIDKKGIDNTVHGLIELAGLGSYSDMPIGNYSKGMAQRLGMAQALVGDPDLLILDEPMANLDPIGRRLFRDIFLKLRKQGKTLFFSTHIIPDVEMICDKVGILINGRIVKEGSLNELLSGHIEYAEMIVKGNNINGIVDKYRSLITNISVNNNTGVLKIDRHADVDAILKDIIALNLKLVSLEQHTESLEDIFVREVRNE